ncbi:MAG TPA: acyl carrier protein [Bacteroidales bacterium]|nr:acyl carrier protein [Bacteroidales bacterium]
MTPEYSQTEQAVRDYVARNVHYDLNKITSKTLLFKEGIFDSMAFVLLIDYLEQGFSIKASDEDLIEENFESIEAISKYILRKKGVFVE